MHTSPRHSSIHHPCPLQEHSRTKSPWQGQANGYMETKYAVKVITE